MENLLKKMENVSHYYFNYNLFSNLSLQNYILSLHLLIYTCQTILIESSNYILLIFAEPVPSRIPDILSIPNRFFLTRYLVEFYFIMPGLEHSTIKYKR